jgi:hypothetical protein
MTFEDSTPTKDNRSLAIGLAFAAAACLFYGAFTHQWLVNGSRFEQYSFGLRSNSTCGQSFGEATECDTSSNGEYIARMQGFGDAAAQYASSAFAPMGWVTFVACLIGAAGLIAAGALALARKQPELPLTPSTAALLAVMVGLITGCVFLATKPGPHGFVGVGASFWIFGAGCVGGIAAAQMLAKVNRPPDPDLLGSAP